MPRALISVSNKTGVAFAGREHANVLLGVERIAGCLREQRCLCPGFEQRALEEGFEKLCGLIF